MTDAQLLEVCNFVGAEYVNVGAATYASGWPWTSLDGVPETILDYCRANYDEMEEAFNVSNSQKVHV